jgi:hypothetical protein
MCAGRNFRKYFLSFSRSIAWGVLPMRNILSISSPLLLILFVLFSGLPDQMARVDAVVTLAIGADVAGLVERGRWRTVLPLAHHTRHE